MGADQGRVARIGVAGEPVRVFIVCEHGPEREALREMLENEGMEVVGSTGSVAEALAWIPVLLPQVALLDARMQDETWICVCRWIWDESPSVRCLTLGSLGNQAELRGTVLAGAQGHAVRMVRGSDLVRRIRAIAVGEDLVDPDVRAAMLAEFGARAPRTVPLDATERHVLLLGASGLSDTEIIRSTGLDKRAFQRVLGTALAKLGYAAGWVRGGAAMDARSEASTVDAGAPSAQPG